MSDLSKIVYLSAAQYETLKTNGTITVDGTTINYSNDDLYLTPDTTVPTGGTSGQVLTKASASDYDTVWATPTEYASKDASNLSSANITSWQSVLNIPLFVTVYDKSSNDSSINWGYTNGINSSITVSGKDFSPYSYLIITVGDNRTDGTVTWEVVAILDLTTTRRNATDYYASSITASASNSNFYKIVSSIKVNADKTSIVITYTGINNAGDGFAQAAGDNMSILKIVGIKLL